MDLYKKIADEEGVSRLDVKMVAFPVLYGSGRFGACTEQQIRNAVRSAIKLGMIKVNITRTR